MSLRNIRRVGGEIVWVIAGQVGAALGALFSVYVLTRWLTTAEYGRLALALTACGIFQGVIFVGPGSAALRFYCVAFEQNESGAFWAALRNTVRLRVIASIGLCAVSIAVLTLGSKWALAGIVASASLLAILQSLAVPLDAVQNAARQRTTVALHQSLGQWLRVG